MGFGIAPSRRGRGYGTEAADAVVAVALEDGGVAAVVAGNDHDNRTSQRVLEKVGFRRSAKADGCSIVDRPA